MPELAPIAAEFFGSLGAADVAAGVGEAAVGAGAAEATLPAVSVIGSAAGDVGAAAGVAGAGAGAVGSYEAASQFGSEGYGPAASPAEMAQGAAGSSTLFDTLGQIFGSTGGKGGMASIFGKGGIGLGLIQSLAGVYGLSESAKLKKLAVQPNKMGEQAVQRSMAAQGYQGSGNMMAALNQFGIDGSLAASRAGAGGLVGQLSSLGLLTSGIPAMMGWGQGTAAAPGG